MDRGIQYYFLLLLFLIVIIIFCTYGTYGRSNVVNFNLAVVDVFDPF